MASSTQTFGIELDGQPIAGVELTVIGGDVGAAKRRALMVIALNELRQGKDVPPPSSDRWTVDDEPVPTQPMVDPGELMRRAEGGK